MDTLLTRDGNFERLLSGSHGAGFWHFFGIVRNLWTIGPTSAWLPAIFAMEASCQNDSDSEGRENLDRLIPRAGR